MGSDDAFAFGGGWQSAVGAGTLPQTVVLNANAGAVGPVVAACAGPAVGNAFTVEIPVQAIGTSSGRYQISLSDADVERIARRVAELLKAGG